MSEHLPGHPVADESGSPRLALSKSLERAVERLERARDFAKPGIIPGVLELCRRMMMQPNGIDQLYGWAPRLDAAGIFLGTDWEEPPALLARLVARTLEDGDRHTLVIECLSELRALAIANEEWTRPGFSSEQAHHFLTQVLAHNLNRVFASGKTEAERSGPGDFSDAIDRLFRYLVEHIGYEDILGSLTNEIWRILGQRPIQVFNAKSMITQIAITLSQSDNSLGDTRLGADRLISALFSPTNNCLDDPGIELYGERLAAMDFNALQQEAYGFARAMHDVGLVSDYHAAFLRWLVDQDRGELISDALGLSSTGFDGLRCYSELIKSLISEAVYPETAQCVYGLAMLLERGVLYIPPVAPGLWRQIGLELSDQAESRIRTVFGDALPARVFLLSGMVSVLGQPLGVGQGNNPTCQSARAISMWASDDPDYLLHLVAQAARFDGVLMHFEGVPIKSTDVPEGLARQMPIDNDPVSTLLVPHLDRVYGQMSLLCGDRGEDPHLWVNPEFHGWWVGRDFAIAVEVETGRMKEYDGFLRHFFASYHPLYNGNQPVIHPQPAGLAVTDSRGRFVGWHAITLLRVALDQTGTMRVYFFNPNNDSGQDWGDGVIVSTQGQGERYGESSLPFEQLASRIYIFHDEPLTTPPTWTIPQDVIDEVKVLAMATWAAER